MELVKEGKTGGGVGEVQPLYIRWDNGRSGRYAADVSTERPTHRRFRARPAAGERVVGLGSGPPM